ncbi:MAG TPA: hypothetical protein VFR87_18615 [Nocardioidaceae bacterium]|nr:hypothetical protein [Nocardioidaceae bacterium]
MEPQRKPRLEPRLVFVFVMLAIPVLYLVAQVVLVRPGEDCGDSAVGGLSQMFVPGVGCESPPMPRTPSD